jgi:hypothetical protein
MSVIGIRGILTKSVGTGTEDDILIDFCMIEVGDDLREGVSVRKAFESIRI